MRRMNLLASRPRFVRQMIAASIAFALFGSPSSSYAQLSRLGNSVPALYPGATMRGTDTAYDPANNVYLVVTGNNAIHGVFVNSGGSPVSGAFVIMSGNGWGHFPRVEYSPHANNGVGGQGAFLVTWHHDVPGVGNVVFGRLVSFSMPGALVTGIQQISDGDQGGSWWETGPAIAYSRTSRRFLVAWRTMAYGIKGRFVDTNGTPVGSAMHFENPGGSRDPALTWNPATDEFGLVYTGFGGSGAFAGFRRIRASDGGLSPRTTFGFAPGTYATAIDVNWSNQYVLAWAVHPGTLTAVFNSNGGLVSDGAFITNRLGHDQSLGLAFNGTSGTFLAVGSDHLSLEVAGVEIKNNGQPNSTAATITNGAALGSFHPLVAARAGTNQWNVVYSRDFAGATNQIVATSSTGGGSGGTSAPPSPPPPSNNGGCTTPDPFASLGGGTCVNGGWLPPGSGGSPPPPPPPPPSNNSGCTTPDPFVSLGGGTCVNGGWLPPGAGGIPPPPPPPPPPSSSCSTPDPFVSLGGGTCVNGGWLPPGSSSIPPPPPPPSAPPSTCTTPDPFVSIGGGTCVNGGWIPNTCSTPDPFVSIGGGLCINGGWLPRSSSLPASSCTTPDPFVSIGGGVCVDGGWRPRAQ